MKKTLFLAVAVCLVLSCVSLADAQTSAPAPGTPPKVITIIREEVKVGKGAAHEKFETNFVRAFARAKWPSHYLAMTALSGPSEAWYLTGYDSFAAWEQDREATEKAAAFSTELDQLFEKDAEFLTGGRNIVAFFRDDLSYNPTTMDVPKARYMRVITYRVRPGHEGDFVEAAKTIRAAYEKTEVKVPWAVYQVTAGVPGPTFLIFLAMKSLQESDEGIARGKARRMLDHRRLHQAGKDGVDSDVVGRKLHRRQGAIQRNNPPPNLRPLIPNLESDLVEVISVTCRGDILKSFQDRMNRCH